MGRGEQPSNGGKDALEGPYHAVRGSCRAVAASGRGRTACVGTHKGAPAAVRTLADVARGGCPNELHGTAAKGVNDAPLGGM